jgi:hypothetical protein
MKENSIFYTIKYEDVEGQDEPNMSFDFNNENLTLANITDLEDKGNDKWKMTLNENGQQKTIESHVLGLIAYLDDLQNNVTNMRNLIKLVDKVEKPKRKTKKQINKDEKGTDKQ